MEGGVLLATRPKGRVSGSSLALSPAFFSLATLRRAGGDVID